MKGRWKRTVESLIPPHVVPWHVDIWIGTGCSKTKMHLTAFCNVWACQPTCMQFSEKIVMGVEEPGEFEKTISESFLIKNDEICSIFEVGVLESLPKGSW